MDTIKVDTSVSGINDTTTLEDSIQNVIQTETKINEKKEITQRTKKRNTKRKNLPVISNEGKKKFTPFDYVNATYSKFVTSGPKNLKMLLSSKISLGTKKKVCKYK